VRSNRKAFWIAQTRHQGAVEHGADEAGNEEIRSRPRLFLGSGRLVRADRCASAGDRFLNDEKPAARAGLKRSVRGVFVSEWGGRAQRGGAPVAFRRGSGASFVTSRSRYVAARRVRRRRELLRNGILGHGREQRPRAEQSGRRPARGLLTRSLVSSRTRRTVSSLCRRGPRGPHPRTVSLGRLGTRRRGAVNGRVSGENELYSYILELSAVAGYSLAHARVGLIRACRSN